MIRGEKIYLRIVTEADLALLNAWSNDIDFNSEYNSFGLQPADAIEKRFAENGLISPQQGRLLIVTSSNDEVIGFVSYQQARYGPNEGSIAFNIGISITSEHRGKGYGVEAQRLLVSYLFSTYPVMRIGASTDKENVAEQKALEKAGFTREGVMRQAQWRSGSWHDLVIYSKLRGE